jgi:hypothetical protein
LRIIDSNVLDRDFQIFDDGWISKGATEIMNLKSPKRNTRIWLFACMVLIASTLSLVHGQGELRHHTEGIFEQTDYDEGPGGATGAIAAWLFALANFTVALSILLKTGKKLLPLESKHAAVLDKINRSQKRRLMRLHYWLNPVAAGVAILHFTHTECQSTFMPELGLGIMLLIIILGLMMTFRLSPTSTKKAVFKLHTSPISFIAAIAVLMIGHSLID